MTTSVRFCLSYDCFILDFIVFKMDIISIENQRTSGPVNAHLIAGPGIYFNAFIHVYSPR